ncbi:Gfo/Idh/MocA family protein [Oceanicola sp. 502str15]|uniref:Gfo/Idh/MocA family protein n=1 Tax=Oceanicola sp. 502str15 TaxID=2696061 RepID=UPI002096041A|nr:Gfo/Idh/MocA family oxidoreductase [Oceanicola sp. 502str15]MCO6381798.1 Gfo/Idh/MocA family oxidoreductase [Oceanicola sp. 502str15]
MKIAGISFDHMHMGDLLRMVHEHPEAEICALYDPDRARMQAAVDAFGVPEERVFTELEPALATAPDLAILCSSTASHAEMAERIAPTGTNLMVEKPFAASASDARRMIAAMQAGGGRMAINWPLRWVESHVTAKALIEAGEIGELLEVRSYGGNRGPLFHLADKVEVTPEEVERQKPGSWWYKRASGGGSLLDYLGYGATLGTWFMNGAAPLEVTCVVDETPGIEVDQHSITICRYARGLSKMETRWGTFTDPWITQPQPACGYTFIGSEGTLTSLDYANHVTLQTRAQPKVHAVPVQPLAEGERNPVEFMLSRLKSAGPIDGPLDPALCLTAQRIIDTAAQSAAEKRTLALRP